MMRLAMIVLAVAVVLVSGCREETPPAPGGGGAEGSSARAPAATNRVDIPGAVRRNLGITFAKVERRSVGRTIRVPGRFELIPTARREYLAMAEGRVEVLVSQYERVEAGAALYRLESSRWRELQEQLNSAEAGVLAARARSESIGPFEAAHAEHERSLREKVKLLAERLSELEAIREAGGGQRSVLTEVRGALKDAEGELAGAAEKDADLAARRREVEAELRSAVSRFELLIDTAAALTGLSADELREPGGEGGVRARWHTLSAIEVKAAAPGVVASIGAASGSRVQEGTLVVGTVQPELVRFHARALQGDLGRLRDGLASRIVPPRGVSVEAQGEIPATLTLGLSAHPNERTVELLASPRRLEAWARAGVSAYLEVTTEGGSMELAVPASCVVRDGARPILFRRDPADPDKVIRMDADVGLSDGAWVVLSSGVKEGDEIVLDGVYQLMLATAGNAPKGGHFHSDGTFHEGED